MIVGIVGLGLIGGSFAKAYKRHQDCTVLAADINQKILEFAKISGDVDRELDDETI